MRDATRLTEALSSLPGRESHRHQVAHGPRGFSFITMSWRGKPLVSLETIVNLIGATTTSIGLEVYARLDPGVYPDKIKSQTPTWPP